MLRWGVCVSMLALPVGGSVSLLSLSHSRLCVDRALVTYADVLLKDAGLNIGLILVLHGGLQAGRQGEIYLKCYEAQGVLLVSLTGAECGGG